MTRRGPNLDNLRAPTGGQARSVTSGQQEGGFLRRDGMVR